MSRSISIFALTLTLLFGCLSATANAPTPKAKSPVSVNIQPVGTIVPGESIDFVVTASVQISSDNVAIQVQPPVGMVLNSGSLSWNGTIARGEISRLTFNASFNDDNNQRIAVRAEVQSPNEARFSARAEYTLNESVTNKASSISAVSTTARTVPRGNGSVVEYVLP